MVGSLSHGSSCCWVPTVRERSRWRSLKYLLLSWTSTIIFGFSHLLFFLGGVVYFFAFFYLICVFISLFFDVVGIWCGILII